jgi:DNA-3-methyladenine glycosylase II
VTLCTDHPAWTPDADGFHRLLSGDDGARWLATWRSSDLSVTPLTGGARSHPRRPAIVSTNPDQLPVAMPEPLSRVLWPLGPVVRISNPSLWDALVTAIIRQDVGNDVARVVVAQLAAQLGVPLDTAAGTLHTLPDAQTVKTLSAPYFRLAAASHFQQVLQRAAAAFLAHGTAWQRMQAHPLVGALQTVRGVNRWTASMAAADYTGNLAILPLDRMARTVTTVDAGATISSDDPLRRWDSWPLSAAERHATVLYTLTYEQVARRVSAPAGTKTTRAADRGPA